jgi:hypothetical protein
MKKTVLLILSYIIMPVLTIIVCGIMQGAWFDSEEIMERPDAETYRPPAWQSYLYYSTLIIISGLHLYFILLYYQKCRSNFQILTIGGALLLWSILLIGCLLSKGE